MFPSLRRSIVASTACFSTLALSACGGAPSLPPAGSAQTLGRNATQKLPPVTNPYPFAQGDVFNYAYSETITTKATGQPVVKTYRIAPVAETIGPVVTYDGQQLTDVNEVDNYTYENSKKQVTGTAVETSDHYRTFSPGSGSTLDYISWGDTTSTNESDTDGTTIASTTQYAYDAPYLIDVVPEAKSTWNDEIPHVESGTTSTTTSGVTITTTYNYTRNPDLSYLRLYTYSKPGQGEYKETDTENADGSGSDANNGKTNPTAGTTTFSAPAKVGGKYVITVVYTPPSGPPTTTEVPDWFPGHGALKSLATDTRKDTGTVKVPASCGKATAGQTAAQLVETTSYLDVIYGTYRTETQTYYVVSGEGTVCAVRKFTLDTYDNRATGSLLTSESSASTSGLTSESLKQLRAKHLVIGFPAGST